MVLSDKDIQEAIAESKLAIEPFNETLLNPGSYTFTLNNVIFKPIWPKTIDAAKPVIEYEKISIGEEGYTLRPGEFVLAQTYETVTVGQSICCVLDARTTLARIGLNVLQGSTFIEPGQEQSHETLEVSNIGKSSIVLFPGMKIVKGIFMSLAGVANQSYVKVGKYGKQSEARVVSEDKI